MNVRRQLERSDEALDRFTRATELPMLLLAISMIPLLLIPWLLELSANVNRTIVAIDWFIWAAFVFELGTKTYLAPARRRFLIRHWYDVLLVVLPFLRPLRVVRSARALRLLRVTRLLTFVARLSKTTRVVLTRHRLDYTLAVAMTAVFASAAAVYYLERGIEGSIDDFGTALWWAIVTVTTVGYGDYSPSSAAGRGVAVLLMLIGIGLFGIVAANIAALFITNEDEAGSEELLNEVRALRDQVDELTTLVRANQQIED